MWIRRPVFTIYYSNDLDVQKNILLTLMQDTLDDPFQSDVILVSKSRHGTVVTMENCGAARDFE